MEKKTEKRISEILKLLDEAYGAETEPTLTYSPRKPHELLIATILSAQCTDERVNQVTLTLFQKYPDIPSFSEANIKELERDIHPCGFYHTKALHIRDCCKMLLQEFGGEVPSRLDDLIRLPGVGRKTANVVRTHVFHEPSIVVDTHVKRISKRLGLTEQTDPVKIEFDLMDKLPKDHWSRINLQLITRGRSICKSQKPKCSECFLNKICDFGPSSR